MQNMRVRMAVLFPLLAIMTIVIFGGGLGIIFIFLNDVVMKEWSVVILGMALVIGVPAVAAFLESRAGEK